MNKKALIVIALVIIAGAGFLLMRSSQRQSRLQDKISQAVANQAAEPGTEVGVDIANFAFVKDVIKIKKGTRVIWTNQDSAKHTVTSDDGGFLDSEAFGKDGNYEKVFERTGTFTYRCKPHPDMIGAVIVVD